MKHSCHRNISGWTLCTNTDIPHLHSLSIYVNVLKLQLILNSNDHQLKENLRLKKKPIHVQSSIFSLIYFSRIYNILYLLCSDFPVITLKFQQGALSALYIELCMYQLLFTSKFNFCLKIPDDRGF